MPLTTLNFKGLAIADGGKLERLLEKQMTRAVADCEDRPGDKTAREVVVKMLVTPQMVSDGEVNVVEANVEVNISSKVPTYRSRPINCSIKQGSRAVFNELSQNNAGQKTLNDEAFNAAE